MGTPFISLLEPTPLPWDHALPSHEQPNASSLPRTFLDAMSVREKVFVAEQNIPQSNEFDSDDARSCHWVIYASVNQTLAPAITDPTTGTTIRPRQSETKSLPIGTIRLVPFPHPPHPPNGGIYINNELTNPAPQQQQQQDPPPHGQTPTFAPDRPTTYHDGHEPYLKLGRLAVIQPFRGHGIAQQLVRAAIEWIRTHPGYFDPSAAERGFESLGMEEAGQQGKGVVPRWAGLLCVHAQEGAVKVWEKCGFRVDEGMGQWMEEGIPHVGMFLRVEVQPEELV